MLSLSDAELANRDVVLQRGLALLLDEDAFLDALGRRLSQISVTSARSLYVRYKPRTNCLVAYRIKSGDLDFDLYAKAFPTGDPSSLKLIENQRTIKSVVGPGCLRFELESVVVSFFPNDAKLKLLRKIGSSEGRSELLQKVVPDRLDLCGGQVEALSYKPERRFVARVASTSGEGAVVLKLYAGETSITAYANSRAFNSCGVLRVPRPLGAHARYGALGLEWLEGTPLDNLLAHSNSYDVLERVGEALAELHAQQPQGLRRPLPEFELQTLLEIARGLEDIAPREAARVETLANKIVNCLARIETPQRPIHGDFYSSQILSADGNISILDFDEAVWGNPVWDLGNFIAHVERKFLGSDDAPSRMLEIKSALLEGYGRAGGPPVSKAALAVFTAASLLKLTHDPFRRREDNWRSQTTAILERAEQLLASADSPIRIAKSETTLFNRDSRRRTRNGGGASEVLVFDPTSAADDEALPFLRSALTPIEALARLRKRLGGLDQYRGLSELQGIRVTRHRPGRRCVIEYDVTLRRRGRVEEHLTLVGKARARGVDERCFNLLVALRQAGFDEQSRDGIAVPEPVTVIPEFHMVLQRKVPGTLCGRILSLSRDPWLGRMIAAGIHKLQRAGIVSDRRHTIHDELEILQRRLATLTATMPQWRLRLDRVMETCLRLGKDLAGRQLRLAHRDFYPEQVIVCGERIYLLDFDLYAAADPALDAGNFIAHITEQSLRQFGDQKALAHHERVILETFAVGSDHATRMAVDAYATLSLVRHICISSSIPQRSRFTEAILGICEQRLGITHGHGLAACT